MTIGRKLPNAADSLSQVAQALIDYILKAYVEMTEQKKHKAGLRELLESVGANYNQPLTSWIFVWWYGFFRKRSAELISMQTAFDEAREQLIILAKIAQFLEQGECKTTSANTLLLRAFIQKLNQYEAIEEHPRFQTLNWLDKNGAITGCYLILRDAFVRQAKETIALYTKISESSTKVMKITLSQPKKLNMSHFGEVERLLGSTMQKKPQKAVVRPMVIENYVSRKLMDHGEIRKVARDLENIFGGVFNTKIVQPKVVVKKLDECPQLVDAKKKLETFFKPQSPLSTEVTQSKHQLQPK